MAISKPFLEIVCEAAECLCQICQITDVHGLSKISEMQINLQKLALK